MRKKKLLAVWWYDRDDLLDIFVKMSNKFEITFLFYKFKSDESKEVKYKTCYWTDYKSPYSLLNAEKPDKVIFLGINSNYPIALNIAAKNLNIPTYYLEHGLRGSLEAGFSEENMVSLKKFKQDERNYTSKNIKKTHSLFYLLHSLKFKNIRYVTKLFKYIYLRYRIKPVKALSKVPFELRNADFYLTFTYKESEYFRERDLVRSEQVIPIGNPFYDDFFKEENEFLDKEFDNYYLLIDSPYWDGIQGEMFNLNYENRDDFYNKLLIFSRKKKSKLIIKLHPLHFELVNFPKDKNLIFIREHENISLLIKKANGVFGFYSTLIIPSIYLNDVVIFTLDENYTHFQEYIRKIEVAEVLDIKNLEVESINFKSKKKVQTFIDDFLYKTDGKSLDRLITIIEK